MYNNIFCLVRSNKSYFISFMLFLFITILYLTINGNGPVSLIDKHPFWLNVFFINFTFMADGLFAIWLAAMLIFYFKKTKAGYSILTAFILTELIVQVIKNIYANNSPTIFFEDGQTIFNSLAIAPNLLSGHTAVAFAIATVLVLMIKNWAGKLFLLGGALLLAYSRIYLSQDSLTGILIASMLGTFIAIFAVYFV